MATFGAVSPKSCSFELTARKVTQCHRVEEASGDIPVAFSSREPRACCRREIIVVESLPSGRLEDEKLTFHAWNKAERSTNVLVNPCQRAGVIASRRLRGQAGSRSCRKSQNRERSQILKRPYEAGSDQEQNAKRHLEDRRESSGRSRNGEHGCENPASRGGQLPLHPARVFIPPPTHFSLPRPAT